MDPRMIFILSSLSIVAAISLNRNAAAEVYEMRTYVTHEGKLDDLNKRFRDHTVDLFAKHGMESIGYWVPTEEPQSQNTLIYVLKHASREAARQSWADFLADPQWKKVAAESQQDGPILAERPEAVFMELTEYSPPIDTAGSEGEQDAGLFELRIYRCNEGKLPNLDARFRDHTIRIFERHGIESVAYWHPTEQPASQDTLIYIVRYKDRAAAQASWEAFRTDQQWRKVAEESQKDGRFLRERPESIYMEPTDYSPLQ